MNTVRQLFKQKNIVFSLQRYGIDALNFMALGLFCSLIIGLILKSLGTWLALPFLLALGTQAQLYIGSAIGIGVAYALQAPPLVLFSSVVTGAIGFQLGGPVGCFFAVAIGSEFGKLIYKSTPVDIILTPATALIVGALTAELIGPTINKIILNIGTFIMWSVELQPFIMGILVAVIMGILLTLPVSSAAIAIALSLGGLAGGAATVGCCAQMIGFAVMSYPENKLGGLLSQGLGTSMLQMPNIVRNPKIILPPILTSAILGPIATLVFQMKNIPSGSGMGTSGFVGQFGTLEAMGNNPSIWWSILLLHFILPAAFTLGFAFLFRKIGWIKAGDLKLHTH